MQIRNIVVSTHTAATDLLHSKAFTAFEKLVPLNRVDGRIELATNVRRIRQVTDGKAELALNLITYEKVHEPALAQVFGTWFVAEDQAAARKIAHDKNSIGAFNCCTL